MEKNFIRPVSRFFIYLIDFLLIGFIVSALTPLAYYIVDFDVEAYHKAQELMNDNFMAFLDGDISMDVLKNSIEVYMEYENVDKLIRIILTFIVMVPYLVIIPLKWKKQTLGRKIVNAKVLNEDGSQVTLKTLIIRELIGSFIFYVVIADFLPIIAIVYWILAYTKRISVVDMISKTRMVPNIPYYIVVDENEHPNYDRFDDNSIKAKYKVVDDRINADDLADLEEHDDSDEYKVV